MIIVVALAVVVLPWAIEVLARRTPPTMPGRHRPRGGSR